MKVVNINPVVFGSIPYKSVPESKCVSQDCTAAKLAPVTPDFKINTPQTYKKIGTDTLPNGLKIYFYKLANGHRVTIVPMKDSPVVVDNYVNVGSLNETDDIKGISHFLEHMAFNGTNGSDGYVKLEHGDSFKKIDELGGWTNASTSYALTDYVNSTPLLDENDLEKQMKIIAAMTYDMSLSKDMIEKEKGPISEEINMILDNPSTIAMDQTMRTLFNIRSSADELVGGSVKHIKNLTREKVEEYYEKYYTPENMNLVITGDVAPDKTVELASKLFKSNKTSKGRLYEEKIIPIKSTVRKDFISDRASSSEVMIGFAGNAFNDAKSRVIYDVVSEYLNRSDTGIEQELNKLNTRLEIGCEKISTNPNNPQFIYIRASCGEENSEKVLKILFDKLSSIQPLTGENLNIIKESLLMDNINSLECSSNVNSITGAALTGENINYVTNYDKILNEITPEDVYNFIKKYMNLNRAAITVVHPAASEEIINLDYEKVNMPAFKGKSDRKPVDMNRVSVETLANNYKAAFYETKNSNIRFNINFVYDIPKDLNPAVIAVLNEIFEMGTLNSSREDFEKYQNKNNIIVTAAAGLSELNLSGYSSSDNFSKSINKAAELLYSPAVTQENLEDAVSRVKERLNRRQDVSEDLYANYESKNNPAYISAEDILNNIDKLTVRDLKKFLKYIMNNSRGTIVMNIPENNTGLKEKAIAEFENLAFVKPYNYAPLSLYKENLSPVVLTKDRNVSQADIMQTYKFEYEKTPAEAGILAIMNTLLSSSSIGLFNSLREKEQLAYNVYSSFYTQGNCGELSCHILTTTDNKETGEINYGNVQKSINGFNRQIGLLLNSAYADSDLESAKKILKAELLNKEAVGQKLLALARGLNSNEGVDFDNRSFDLIDSITREDIQDYARKVFKNPPIYSIVASKDTLEANKEFFDTLRSQS